MIYLTSDVNTSSVSLMEGSSRWSGTTYSSTSESERGSELFSACSSSTEEESWTGLTSSLYSRSPHYQHRSSLQPTPSREGGEVSAWVVFWLFFWPPIVLFFIYQLIT